MRQRLIWKSMMVLCGLSMALLWPASANAGDCDEWSLPDDLTDKDEWEKLLCGTVDNFSSWTMHFTTMLRPSDGKLQPDEYLCDVWNWDGGSAAVWQQAECYQQALEIDGSVGGGTVDVDAFTISTRDYMLNFHGSWSWQTKGVWTKIQNFEDATCYTYWEFYIPMCYVTYAPWPFS
jgi:hypothetical protein